LLTDHTAAKQSVIQNKRQAETVADCAKSDNARSSAS